jgi:hypothetical protein
MDLGELQLHGSWHMHDVCKWLLHLHELVAAHHLRELLSILVRCCKHHLHVHVWIHIHALSRETHLPRHHHSLELTHIAHVHVHRSRHSLRLVTNFFIWAVLILVLSQLCLSMSIRTLGFVLAVTV